MVVLSFRLCMVVLLTFFSLFLINNTFAQASTPNELFNLLTDQEEYTTIIPGNLGGLHGNGYAGWPVSWTFPLPGGEQRVFGIKTDFWMRVSDDKHCGRTGKQIWVSHTLLLKGKAVASSGTWAHQTACGYEHTGLEDGRYEGGVLADSVSVSLSGGQWARGLISNLRYYPTKEVKKGVAITIFDQAKLLGSIASLAGETPRARRIYSSNKKVLVWFSSEKENYPSLKWFYNFKPSALIADRGANFKANGELAVEKNNDKDALGDSSVYVYACLDTDMNGVCDYLEDRDFYKDACENTKDTPSQSTHYGFSDEQELQNFGVACCGDDGVLDCNMNYTTRAGKSFVCDKIGGDWKWMSPDPGTVYESKCFYNTQLLWNGSERLMCGTLEGKSQSDVKVDIAAVGMAAGSFSVEKKSVNFDTKSIPLLRIGDVHTSSDINMFGGSFSLPRRCTSVGVVFSAADDFFGIIEARVSVVGGSSPGSKTVNKVSELPRAGDTASAAEKSLRRYILDLSDVLVSDDLVESVGFTVKSNGVLKDMECFSTKAVPRERVVNSVELTPGVPKTVSLSSLGVTTNIGTVTSSPGKTIILPLSKSVLLSKTEIKKVSGDVEYTPGIVEFSDADFAGGVVPSVYAYIPSTAEARDILIRESARQSRYEVYFSIPDIGKGVQKHGYVLSHDGAKEVPLGETITHNVEYSLSAPLTSYVESVKFQGVGSSTLQNPQDTIPGVVVILKQENVPLTMSGTSAAPSQPVSCIALDVSLNWGRVVKTSRVLGTDSNGMNTYTTTQTTTDIPAPIVRTVVKGVFASDSSTVALADVQHAELLPSSFEGSTPGTGENYLRYDVSEFGSVPADGSTQEIDIPSQYQTTEFSKFVIENYYSRVDESIGYGVSYDQIAGPSTVTCIPNIPIIAKRTSTFSVNGGTPVEKSVERTTHVVVDGRSASANIQLPPPSLLRVSAVYPSTISGVSNDIIAGFSPDNLGRNIVHFDSGTFSKIFVKIDPGSLSGNLIGASLKELPRFSNVSVTSSDGLRTHDFVCAPKKVSDAVDVGDLQVRECAVQREGDEETQLSRTMGNRIDPLAEPIRTLVKSDDPKLFENPSLSFLKSGNIGKETDSGKFSRCRDDCQDEVKKGFKAPFLQEKGMILLRVNPKNNTVTRDGAEESTSWNAETTTIVLLSYNQSEPKQSFFKLFITGSSGQKKVVCELNDGNNLLPLSATSSTIVDVEKPFIVGARWSGVQVDCLLNNNVFGSLTPSTFAIPNGEFYLGDKGYVNKDTLPSPKSLPFGYHLDTYSSNESVELYCTTPGRWVKSLDALGNKLVCSKIEKSKEWQTTKDVDSGKSGNVQNVGDVRKFVWTGSQCCGEWNQIPELYNDPLSVIPATGVLITSGFVSGRVKDDSGGCWNSGAVKAGSDHIQGQSIPLYDGSVLNVNGSFIGCAVTSAEVLALKESKSGVPSSKPLLEKVVPTCGVVNVSLHTSLPAPGLQTYAICQPGSGTSPEFGKWDVFGLAQANTKVKGFTGANPDAIARRGIYSKLLTDSAPVPVVEIPSTASMAERVAIESKFNLSVPEDKTVPEIQKIAKKKNGAFEYYSVTGCCMEGQCWDGQRCYGDQREDSTDSALVRGKYRCEPESIGGKPVGVWVEKVSKNSSDYGQTGFCPKNDQCFVRSPGTGSFVGNRSSWYKTPDARTKTWCVPSGEFFTWKGTADDASPRDVLCDGGGWSFRSEILSSKLYEFGGSELELSCEKNGFGSSNFGELDGEEACTPAGGDVKDSCFSTVCALKRSGKNTVVGMVLNIPLNDSPVANPSVSIMKVLGCSGSECSVVIDRSQDSFGEFSIAGRTVWYHPKLQLLVFSNTSADVSGFGSGRASASLKSTALQQFSPVFNSQAPLVKADLYCTMDADNNACTSRETLQPLFSRGDFSTVYVAKKGDKSVFATLVRSVHPGEFITAGKTGAGNNEMSASSALFSVFVKPGVNITRNTANLPLGSYYDESSQSYYLFTSDADFMGSSSDSASWNDLTAKLRILGGGTS